MSYFDTLSTTIHTLSQLAKLFVIVVYSMWIGCEDNTLIMISNIGVNTWGMQWYGTCQLYDTLINTKALFLHI